MTNIKTSSGKVIGYVDIVDNKIIIHNDKKPELIIEDDELLEAIKKEDRSNSIIKKMYDEYYLGVGEIAALYNVCYANMNRQTKQITFETKKNEDRRNPSYRVNFSQERRDKISKALKEGHANGTIKPSYYERTPEIREKISNSLKEYFKEHPQDPAPHINNWKNGVYDNVDFHIGIGGTFYSHKNKKTFNFRSLLELAYCLMLEKDDSIKKYEYEALRIECENGHIYTPDIFINDELIVELKPKKYVEKVKGIKPKVMYKKEQAEKYCKEHNLTYKIVYDEDIDYESDKFKRYLNSHPDIMSYYKITINQPERMVTK